MQYNAFKSAGNANWGRFSGLFRYKKQLAYAGAGLGIFYLANLEKAPVTGRYRFMIVPKWLEKKVGQSAYSQTMEQYGRYVMPDSYPQHQHVKGVMDRLIHVADLPNTNWKIHVIRGDFPPNAFVLPDGKVFVFESILPICKDEDGLATVLSHETAHQVCRHTSESLSKAPIMWGFAIAMYLLTGSTRLNDLMIQFAFELPASRNMETEADYVGVRMMAKACFNPDKSVNLWQRMMDMERRGGQYVPELLSTHPTSARRIEDIKAHLPEAEQIRNDNCEMAQQFWSF